MLSNMLVFVYVCVCVHACALMCTNFAPYSPGKASTVVGYKMTMRSCPHTLTGLAWWYRQYRRSSVTVCVCVCVCMCVCVCVRACVRVWCVCVHVFVCHAVCICICECEALWVCVCICACVYMSVCTCACDLLDSREARGRTRCVVCVCVCIWMCVHIYVVCTWHVFIVWVLLGIQSSGMRLDGPVGVGIVWDWVVLFCLAALHWWGPTARNSHLDGCSLPKWEREWKKCEDGMHVNRRERKERERGHLVHLCVCIWLNNLWIWGCI